MSVHVYNLYSSKIDKFYVGSTDDLMRRLQQHNTGLSTDTSTGIPWMLLWPTAKPTRHDAEVLEGKLKYRE
ncbi:MAG: GIY-YIG nuclease family protein, partial [Cyanothece sp. SIO1E1]|nr:GIY-YIG nuclease family protein [Cyanothece sp. SIO1E1]